MLPHYPIPWNVIMDLVLASIIGYKRSFGMDARRSVDQIIPPMRVYGQENIPKTGPYIVTINHYWRPGFRAWWLALAVSSIMPQEVHWVVTDAWRFETCAGSHILEALSRWIFIRLAMVYGFTPMPPMPPNPSETSSRALAVRRLLKFVNQNPLSVIGFAPEGRDMPGGILGEPPQGTGRFLLHLVKQNFLILPVGIYEQGQEFCLNVGDQYCLQPPINMHPDDRDRVVRKIIMEKIAALVPKDLRGGYSFQEEK